MKLVDYITTAMVAWNEVYQGYPDHWVKVHGNLTTASELATDPELKTSIEQETKTFYDSYTKQEKYRPKFESLACQAMNLENNTNLCGNVINGMLCYDCCLKHISDAQGYFYQLQENPEDITNFMWVIGNLSHAADHLVEQYEGVANHVREERKKFYNSYIADKTNLYTPDFNELSTIVLGLIS